MRCGGGGGGGGAVRQSESAPHRSEMALDPRAIVLSLDDVLVNPVLVAGPEQHETKQTSDVSVI